MTEIAKDRPPKGKPPRISITQLKKLWLTNKTTEEIAVSLRISLSYLQSFARQHGLPKRTHVPRKRIRPAGEIDPTPEEIIARCAEVRARWTEREWNRNLFRPKPVEIQQYSYDSRTGIFSDVS